MCLATLSTKAGKRLHAALLALPHPRGFISLTTEQQQLETANQHAVSKGRLRWQLRARAMLSACCHLVIAHSTRGTASQLVGRLACQQTLPPPPPPPPAPPARPRGGHWRNTPHPPPHRPAPTHPPPPPPPPRSCSDAYTGEESWMNPPHPPTPTHTHTHTHHNPCVMFFSLLTPPLPLFLPPPPSNSPLPQMLGKKKSKQQQTSRVVCLSFLVGGGVVVVVFVQSPL